MKNRKIKKLIWVTLIFVRLGLGEQTKKTKSKSEQGKCVGNAPEGVLQKKYEYAYNLPPMNFLSKNEETFIR